MDASVDGLDDPWTPIDGADDPSTPRRRPRHETCVIRVIKEENVADPKEFPDTVRPIDNPEVSGELLMS
jgi:hypothetical protein